jgi:hypothetical protein
MSSAIATAAVAMRFRVALIDRFGFGLFSVVFVAKEDSGLRLTLREYVVCGSTGDCSWTRHL